MKWRMQLWSSKTSKYRIMETVRKAWSNYKRRRKMMGAKLKWTTGRLIVDHYCQVMATMKILKTWAVWISAWKERVAVSQALAPCQWSKTSTLCSWKASPSTNSLTTSDCRQIFTDMTSKRWFGRMRLVHLRWAPLPKLESSLLPKRLQNCTKSSARSTPPLPTSSNKPKTSSIISSTK